MKDIQKIKEFFSKPLKEVSGKIDIEDFNKVVQAIQQTNYPVTVMLTSMFGNEIEIIVGMDAPDPLIDAISDIMDDLGYNSSRDYSIAGDSSTLSRRQYDEIRRINGGHKDYYRESVINEAETIELNDKQKKYLRGILNNRYGKGSEIGYVDNGIEEFIQRAKLDLSMSEFQDLLNQNILKIRTKPGKKPYKALFLSKDLTKMNLDENKKTDLVKKVKEAITAAYETMDINDPVLMKARAAAFQRTLPKPEPVKTTNPDYKAIKNADKIKALQMRRAEIMRDMEQEAEPEGGPIANRYGDMLNKIDKAIAMLSEAKKETAVDMAKKKLDALGVKYEMSATDKVRPFKVIYKPINKSDKFYDEFEDIVDLFNLKGFVKSSMDEAKFMSGMFTAKDFINAKLKNYPKAQAKVNQLINMIGESKFTQEMAEWIWDFFNNASFERPVYEASKDEETEFHKKLDKLVHSTFGKRKGELEEAVNLKASKLSSAEYQKAKKLKDFKSSDWKWNADEDLYTKVNEAELTEAYVPSNIKEFAKRKGVSSLVNKVAGWAEKVGAGIRGGTAIGMNYSTLILDMTYQGSEIRINTDNDTVTLYDEPVYSFNDFKQVYLDNQDIEENVAPNHNGKAAPYGSGYKPLEERIAEALDKINEELCPAGKAYIKRRQAAGEKSSAYLSGRGVKVCKGQMSGKAKKK